jgi:hemoglobin-like flavoprotein
MSLTANQILSVQRTFGLAAVKSDEVARTFYNRLFEIDPSLRRLFKEDMTDQERKLMQTLSVAVGSLNHLEQIVPIVQELGKRHVNYGVKKEDYAKVGEALLWTLEKELGELFTPDVKEAWTEVYTLLAETATSEAYSFA